MRHRSLYIRPLESADIPSIARLLDDSLLYDTVTPEWVRDKAFNDPDYDSTLVLCAFDGGRLVAFAHGVARPSPAPVNGWFKWFAVAEDMRRDGIATKLCDQIERAMKRKGVQRVGIADSVPNYTLPGVDSRMTEARAFLQQRGFKEGDERVSMICPLRANSWDTAEAEQRFETEGVAFRRAGRSDLQPTLDFIRTGFPYWTAEAATCFLRRPISLHLAEELGIVIGFAAYDANNPGLAWFGPTGVQPDKRRRGIGEVLLKRCLRDLRDQGHEEAVIPWVGPVSFYEKACQATIYRRFLPVQKAL